MGSDKKENQAEEESYQFEVPIAEQDSDFNQGGWTTDNMYQSDDNLSNLNQKLKICSGENFPVKISSQNTIFLG